MRRSGLAVLALALAACDGSNEPGPPSVAPVASVTISPGDVSVVMEDQVTISATLKDAAGNILTGRDVIWGTVSPAVASMDNLGTVSGHTLGVTLLTATSEGKADTISARVIPAVVVSPRLPSLFTGDTTQLAVTLLTANGRPAGTAPTTWAATTGGTTVDAAGVVRGGTPGVVRVTATAAGGTGTVDVAVIKRPGTLTRKIAWQYFEGATHELWVADADGSNAQRVSPPNVYIMGYAWSPNGDRLVISTRDPNFAATPIVYIVSVDGAVLLEAPSSYAGYAPAWSADGEQIVFTNSPYVVVMQAATGHFQLFGSGLTGVTGVARWSPDGRTIAFGSDACSEIALMDADGTNRRLLDIPRTCDAYWSPDGKLLAYDLYAPGGDLGVFLVPAAGGTPIPVSPNCLTGPPCSYPNYQVVEWWSDGYSLAMRSIEFMSYDRRTGAINPLGTNGNEWTFGWSPDGTRALGYSYPDGDLNSRIAVMNADLTNPQFISTQGRSANWATWQPSP